MLKHFAATNLFLAGAFGLPNLVGPQDNIQGLLSQLDATISSIDYVGELARRIQARDSDALPLLLGATEPRRQNELQSEARIVSLRGDVSRLQLSLDRMLEEQGIDPRMPGVHDRGPTDAHTLPARVPRTPGDWTPGTLAPTVGLESDLRGNLQSVLPPLQRVDPGASRRGDTPVALEQTDFTADAVRHGKLLLRAGRYPEAITLLQPYKGNHEARYWLAQGYRAMERIPDALEILRSLAGNEDAGAYARYAASDIDFIEFEREVLSRSDAGRGDNR